MIKTSSPAIRKAIYRPHANNVSICKPDSSGTNLAFTSKRDPARSLSEEDYPQEFYDDDYVNLNCVLSCKLSGKDSDDASRVQIWFHNGFIYDSVKDRRAQIVRRRLKTLTRSRGESN
jgi:hypothetical protein